jgi:uncharacterized protein
VRTYRDGRKALGALAAALAGVLSVLALACGPLVSDASARTSLPRPSGFVSDFAGFISPGAESAITGIASEVRAKTGAEIAVATVETTAGVAIEPFATQLFTDWGIGERGKDNGVLIVVATQDHQMFIKPGYGLEGAIPDAVAFGIYRDVLQPGFRAGEYDQALVTAVNMIAGLILKENGLAYAYGDSVSKDLLLTPRTGRAGQGPPGWMIIGSMFFLFFFMVAMRSFAVRHGLARGPGGFWMGGFGGGGSSGGFGGGFGGFGGGSAGGGGAGGGW